MTATLADDLGDIVVTVLVLARDPRIPGRFLQRITISALHVLDDRKLERFAVACFDRHDWNFVQRGALSRPPASLASNNFVGIFRAVQRTHNDRLDDAVLLD